MAHSIEVWHRSELIGGICGVGIGSNGSKFALAALCFEPAVIGVPLFDVQVSSAYMMSLGGELVASEE
jgi:leucyl/phenylalanyl-tRNA--protein transferase